MLIPYHQLPENAKVWIYQSSRNFNVEEVAELSIDIEAFVEAWQSHQVPVLWFWFFVLQKIYSIVCR
jgi:hypothetical protein